MWAEDCRCVIISLLDQEKHAKNCLNAMISDDENEKNSY